MRLLIFCFMILYPLSSFSLGYIVENLFNKEGIGYLEQTACLIWFLVLPSITSTQLNQAFYLDNVVFSENSVTYIYGGSIYFSNVTGSYQEQPFTSGLLFFESSH